MLHESFPLAQTLQGAKVNPAILVHVLCEEATCCHIAGEDQQQNKIYTPELLMTELLIGPSITERLSIPAINNSQ